MDTLEVKKQLGELNSARVGSFGEYVLSKVATKEGYKVESVHYELTDYRLNGSSTDVKARRKLEFNYKKPPKYSGKRVRGVNYATVLFCKDNILVNYENGFLKVLNWTEVGLFWEEWTQGTKGFIRSVPVQNREERKAAIEPIKEEISRHFKNNGWEARVIYRTNQKDFGKESPGNLVPKSIIAGHLTVMLDFDYKIDRENIFRIVAFPDIHSDKFPRLEKERLHVPKVDLSKIQREFIFNNLDDLYSNFAVRFGILAT